MIDTRSQYIIHKENETKLLHQIEQMLATQERGKYAETRQPWYSAAEQWLKENVFSPRSAKSDCCPDGSSI